MSTSVSPFCHLSLLKTVKLFILKVIWIDQLEFGFSVGFLWISLSNLILEDDEDLPFKTFWFTCLLSSSHLHSDLSQGPNKVEVL